MSESKGSGIFGLLGAVLVIIVVIVVIGSGSADSLRRAELETKRAEAAAQIAQAQAQRAQADAQRTAVAPLAMAARVDALLTVVYALTDRLLIGGLLIGVAALVFLQIRGRRTPPTAQQEEFKNGNTL